MMKNFAITFSFFVLACVSALPGAAQRRQPADSKQAGKPTIAKPSTPAPTTTATAPKTEQSGALQGKVVDLGWGDAVTVLDAQGKQHRVRLLGIDAPEKEQAFGPSARQKLSALVFGKMVAVKYQKVDKQGRPLGKVLLGALDVNLEMLKLGLAWYYGNDRDLPESDRPLYSKAEREARAASRGLWGDDVPMPPWEFRRLRREQRAAAEARAAEATPDPAVKVNAKADEKADDPEEEAPAEKQGQVEKQGAMDKPAEGAGGQADGATKFPKAPKEAVTGDNITKIYYKAGCPEVDKVYPQNRVSFPSAEEAEKAGYRRTPNCP